MPKPQTNRRVKMSKKNHRKLFHRIRGFAAAKKLPLNKGYGFYAPLLEQMAGIDAPKPGEMFSSPRARCKIAIEMIENDGKTLPFAIRQKKSKNRCDAKAFYRSYEWRKLRLEIIKRDGPYCLCCGQGVEHGVVLNVDHIKPLKSNWELRLDPDNLQVLCNQCNHGKGNWDETDWRNKQRGFNENHDPSFGKENP